jgi:voltage-gated potassium channel
LGSDRPESPARRFRLPGALLAVVVVYGTAGYMLVEHWNLLDAFYMTVITISTVGYGEVHPVSAIGRIFTTTLIIGGVGILLYGFGVFAETLSEGHFIEYRRYRRLERQIAAMRQHFIVCGYGRMGTRIVVEFEEQKVDYVVVDTNPDAIARLRRENRTYIEGDAADEDVLHAAGIEHARCLISAVDSDERSVYITLAARALNPNLYIVARAGQPGSIRRLELAGASHVVSPYIMAGHRMAEFALHPELKPPKE